MGGLRYFVALAALAVASGANAANFLAYTFTGHGVGYRNYYSTQTGIEETFIPLGSFSTTVYVSLDQGSNCEGGGGSSGGCYEGNGVDRYFILGPGITERNVTTLDNGILSVSDTSFYRSDISIDVSASFQGSAASFADLGSNAKFLGGGLSYSNVGIRYSEGFSGEVTGFSVRTVTEPGDVVVMFQAIPEPSTWVMMLAGFGFVGMGLRRRQQSVTSLTYA